MSIPISCSKMLNALSRDSKKAALLHTNYPRVLQFFLHNINQFIQLLSPFILLKIYAKTYSPVMFGQIGLCMTLISAISILTTGPTCAAILNIASISDRTIENLFRLLEASKRAELLDLKISATIAIGSATVLLLMYRQFNVFILTLFVVVYLALNSNYLISQALFNGLARREIAALTSFFEHFFRMLFSLLILNSKHNELYLPFMLLCLGSLFGYLFRAAVIAKYYKYNIISCAAFSEEDKYNPNQLLEIEKHIFNYSLPYRQWGIALFVERSSDQFFLAIIHGPAVVGYYQILQKAIIQPIVLITSQVISFVEPSAFRLFSLPARHLRLFGNRNLSAIILLYISMQIILSFVIATSFTLIAPNIISFFVGNVASIKYNSVYFPAAFSACAFSFGQLNLMLATAAHSPYFTRKLRLVFSFLFVPSCLLSAFIWSMNGVVYTVLIFNSLLMLSSALRFKSAYSKYLINASK